MIKASKRYFLYVVMGALFSIIIYAPFALAKNKKVLSFENLNQLEKYEDLPKYGLIPPNKSNHESGKNLIMLALNANSYFKGDWTMAHGLLGVSMLNVELHDRLGYKSLFLSCAFNQSFKLLTNQLIRSNALLIKNDRVTISPMKSIIAKREAALYAMGCEIESRYTYNDAGNFDRGYSPQPSRKNNKYLEQVIIQGLRIYKTMKKQGFNDKTLGDAIGIANASLSHDGALLPTSDIIMLGPPQIFHDALNSTLEMMKNKPEHSYNFLSELGWQMQSRGLAVDDLILLPEDESNFEAILRIVEKDLQAIRKDNRE